MHTELQQQLVKHLELNIKELSSAVDNYAARLLANSSNKSTKQLTTSLNKIAKLIDTLDILDEDIPESFNKRKV